MKAIGRHEQKGSAILNVIILLLVAYGIFVGVQYAPIMIESRTIDAMLNSIAQSNQSAPAENIDAVESMLNNQLYINEMTDMRDSFDIDYRDRAYTIRVNYERSLNLGFDQKTLKYQKSMTLR